MPDLTERPRHGAGLCDSCGEPAFPLVTCAECETWRICEHCCFDDDCVCPPCHRLRERAVCRRTGEPAADCICTEVDDAHIDC